MSGEGIAYRVRGATPSDLEGLLALSAFLDTVNLPHDRDALDELLARSERSFRGERRFRPGTYVFVAEERATGRLVAASMLVEKLGTRRAPYVYFEQGEEERYCRSLDRHFRHAFLKIRYVYDGPTELAGLVVDPALRGSPSRLGRQVAFARFAYMAARPERFERECLAELMPPLRPDGGSDFWDAIGRHFTGLGYREADRLSRVDKDFIRDLFPEAPLYVSLLPRAARQAVGQVRATTAPARAMLERAGFVPAPRVDPFDGGPHFVAPTRSIGPVAGARSGTLATLAEGSVPGLIARVVDHPPFMLAAHPGELAPGDRLHALRTTLDADENAHAIAVPFHKSHRPD